MEWDREESTVRRLLLLMMLLLRRDIGGRDLFGDGVEVMMEGTGRSR